MSAPALRLTIGIACTLSAASLWAQPAGPASAKDQSLPSGVEVVRRSVVAAGGNRVDQIETIVIRGTFSIAKAGTRGSLVTQYSAPDRARVTIDLGAQGKTVQLIHGNSGWESSPSLGMRKLDARETARLLESTSMRNALVPEQVYATMHNKGIEEIDGEACYHLELTRRGETVSDQVFYSLKTGLPRKTILSRRTATGVSEIQSLVSGYKDFAGIKVATKVVQHIEALGMTYEIQIESVELDVPLDESLFQMPAPAKDAAAAPSG